MSRPLTKKAIACILCMGMIASSAFPFPALAATSDSEQLDPAPSFPKNDIYYNNYLDFYNGTDTATGGKISDSLLLIPNFKTYIQNQHNTCGNVASMMVENYYTGCGLNEAKVKSISTAMNTGEEGGTGTEAVKAYFDDLGWYTLVNYSKKDGNYDSLNKEQEALTWPVDCSENGTPNDSPFEPLKFLRNNVAEGIPTMVECLDWGGHWMVVVGYDEMDTPGFNSKDDIRDDVIIMADSGDKTDHNWDGYYIYPAARFLYEWYDDYCLIQHNDAWKRWNMNLSDTVYLWHPFVLACPPVIAKTDISLTAKSLNSAVIHLSLKGTQFKDENLDQSSFSLSGGAPGGLAISKVNYIGNDKADVILSYPGTTIAADRNFCVQVKGGELTTEKDAVSSVVPVASKTDAQSSDYSGSHRSGSTDVASAPAQPQPKITDSQGVKISTLALDSDFITGQLKTNPKEIAVEVANGSGKVVGQIGGNLLQAMSDKKVCLRIKTEKAQYLLPVDQIDLQGISSKLGANASLKDVMFNIAISESAQDTAKTIKESAAAGGYTLVADPVQFEIYITCQGKSTVIDKFNCFVERDIALPDGIQPEQVSAAVVLQADGTLRSVPMKMVKIDGKNYAKVSSRTNSTYALISGRTEFSDTAHHWAKAAVSDLASRLVIKGTSQHTFGPDKAITRAEFAAMIVKSLGIEEEGSTPYHDVKESDWFKDCVAAASNAGLISGYADGSFKPNQQITREEAMVILLRATKLAGHDINLSVDEVSDCLNAFSDRSTVSSWAQNAVAVCVKENIASGRSANSMAPRSSVTRAEICVMLQRALQQSGLI